MNTRTLLLFFCLIFGCIKGNLFISKNDYYFPVPLRSVEVKAKLWDFIGLVTVEQVYENNSPDHIEATYTFPLDEKCSITSFKAIMDDREILAVSKPKDLAVREYEEAISSGYSAYLLEQVNDEVFTVRVGNIPPGKTVKIVVTYLTEVSMDGDDLRFILPTTISHRYVPFDEAPVNINPPTFSHVPYSIKINVDMEMPSQISMISSPSHPITVKLDGSKGIAELGKESEKMDKDFVLLIGVKETKKSRVWVEQNDDGSYSSMLVLYPNAENITTTTEVDTKREIIFVVDYSGSMSGNKIESAKEALRSSLKFLLDRCKEMSIKLYFRILMFSDSYYYIFEEPRLVNEDNLKLANEEIDHITADGGTELVSALRSIVIERNSGLFHSTLDKTLIIMTDGQISNPDVAIKLIADNSDIMRVFTIGIGESVSYYLVNGLAKAGNGVSEFVVLNEPIVEKAMRHVARALETPLIIKNIDWKSTASYLTPLPLAPINTGIRYKVFAKLNEVTNGVTVSLDNHQDITIDKDNVYHIKGDTILKLLTRSRIRDLELGNTDLAPKDAKEEVIKLATKYNLMSSFTSMVAVDNKSHADSIKTVKYFVPQQRSLSEKSNNYHADILLLDVTPLALGFEDKQKFVVVIDRNSVIPQKKTSSIQIENEQTTFELKILQCSGDGVPSSACHELGILKIQKPVGRCNIELVYTIDVNGELSVMATIVETNESFTFSSDNSNQLTPMEIEKMVKEYEMYYEKEEL